MRVLIVNAHRNLVGGVEKYLQAVLPGLLDCGHELGLLHQYPADPDREHIDPPAGFGRLWCLGKSDPQAALDSVAEWKPDVVYSQGLEGRESETLERTLLSRHRVVLYVHNYDRTCATGRKCYSFPEFKPCDRQLGPGCLALHYPRRCGGLDPRNMWEQYQRNTQLNSQFAGHAAVLVASRHMHREMERHGVHSEKLFLAPLPTTDAKPESTPPVSKPITGKILFVGRLTDIKGAGYLIQAIPRAARELGRTLTLQIAGDGPEGGKLRALANRLGVAVEFLGWVPTMEKLNLMRQVDLLAVPSLWPEPFGLVGIEAGCLGLPAVGYATGGIPDWLVAGETGELAPGDPPTVEGLAEAMIRALASPEHHARLATGAWSLAKLFTLENHLARLEPILAGLPSPVARQPGAGMGVLHEC